MKIRLLVSALLASLVASVSGYYTLNDAESCMVSANKFICPRYRTRVSCAANPDCEWNTDGLFCEVTTSQDVAFDADMAEAADALSDQMTLCDTKSQAECAGDCTWGVSPITYNPGCVPTPAKTKSLVEADGGPNAIVAFWSFALLRYATCKPKAFASACNALDMCEWSGVGCDSRREEFFRISVEECGSDGDFSTAAAVNGFRLNDETTGTGSRYMMTDGESCVAIANHYICRSHTSEAECEADAACEWASGLTKCFTNNYVALFADADRAFAATGEEDICMQKSREGCRGDCTWGVDYISMDTQTCIRTAATAETLVVADGAPVGIKVSTKSNTAGRATEGCYSKTTASECNAVDTCMWDDKYFDEFKCIIRWEVLLSAFARDCGSDGNFSATAAAWGATLPPAAVDTVSTPDTAVDNETTADTNSTPTDSRLVTEQESGTQTRTWHAGLAVATVVASLALML